MNLFERYLTVWVFLCIVAGIALGQFFPAFFQLIGHLSIAQVNLPVGVLIWVMIIPMLAQSRLRRARRGASAREAASASRCSSIGW
jgi:ACR3 family arsenite efflux pump ArsB